MQVSKLDHKVNQIKHDLLLGSETRKLDHETRQPIRQNKTRAHLPVQIWPGCGNGIPVGSLFSQHPFQAFRCGFPFSFFDGGQFARKTLKCRLVDLPLAV